MGANKSTLSAVLWAANAVVWGYVYMIDRNLKASKRADQDAASTAVSIDLAGQPIEVAYQKKMMPEFTIYQV